MHSVLQISGCINSPKFHQLKAIGEYTEKISNGQISVQIYPFTPLEYNDYVIKQIQAGIIQILTGYDKPYMVLHVEANGNTEIVNDLVEWVHQNLNVEIDPKLMNEDQFVMIAEKEREKCMKMGKGQSMTFQSQLPAPQALRIRKPSVASSIPSSSSSLSLYKESLYNGFAVGDRVFVLPVKIHGILRYLGETEFRDGIWAGVELEVSGAGKNDGSVKGKAYFSCAPNTGIFVAVDKITAPIVSQPALSRSNSSTLGSLSSSSSKAAGSSMSSGIRQLLSNKPSSAVSPSSTLPSKVASLRQSMSTSAIRKPSTPTSLKPPSPSLLRKPSVPSLSNSPNSARSLSRNSSIASMSGLNSRIANPTGNDQLQSSSLSSGLTKSIPATSGSSADLPTSSSRISGKSSTTNIRRPSTGSNLTSPKTPRSTSREEISSLSSKLVPPTRISTPKNSALEVSTQIPRSSPSSKTSSPRAAASSVSRLTSSPKKLDAKSPSSPQTPTRRQSSVSAKSKSPSSEATGLSPRRSFSKSSAIQDSPTSTSRLGPSNVSPADAESASLKSSPISTPKHKSPNRLLSGRVPRDPSGSSAGPSSPTLSKKSAKGLFSSSPIVDLTAQALHHSDDLSHHSLSRNIDKLISSRPEPSTAEEAQQPSDSDRLGSPRSVLPEMIEQVMLKNEILETENGFLRLEVSQDKARLEASKSTEKRLLDELVSVKADYLKRIEELETRVQEETARLSRTHSRESLLQSQEVQDIKITLDDKNSHISQLMKDLEDSRMLLKRQSKQIEDSKELKAELDQSRTQCAELATTLQDLNYEMEALIKTSAETDARQMKKMNGLELVASKFEKENKELNKALAELQASLTTGKVDEVEYLRLLNDRKKMESNYELKISELSGDLKRARDEREDMGKKLNEVTEQLQSMESEKSRLLEDERQAIKSEMEEAVKKLQVDVILLEREKSEMSQKVTELTESLERSLTENNRERARLHQEILTLQKEEKEATQIREDLTANNSKLSQTVIELEASLEKLQSENENTITAAGAERSKLIDEFEQKIGKIVAERDSACEERDKLLTTVAKLSTAQNDAQLQLERLRQSTPSDSNAHSDSLVVLENEKQELAKEVRLLEDDVARHKEKYSSLIDGHNRLKSRLEDSETRLLAFERKSLELETERQNLNESILRSNQQVQLLQSKLDDVEHLLLDLDGEKNVLLQKNQKLEEMIRKLELELSSTATRNEELTKVIEGLKRKSAEYESEITRLQNLVAEKERQEFDLRDQLGESQSKLSALKSTVASLESERDPVRDSLDTLNSAQRSADQYEKRCSALDAANLELQSQVSQIRQLYDESKNLIASREIELQSLQSKNSNLMTQVDELKNQISVLKEKHLSSQNRSEELPVAKEENTSALLSKNHELVLELGRYQKREAELAEQLLECEESLRDLKATLTIMSENSDALLEMQKSLQQKDREIKELQASLEETRNQMTEMESRSRDLESSLERKVIRETELEEDLNSSLRKVKFLESTVTELEEKMKNTGSPDRFASGSRKNESKSQVPFCEVCEKEGHDTLNCTNFGSPGRLLKSQSSGLYCINCDIFGDHATEDCSVTF